MKLFKGLLAAGVLTMGCGSLTGTAAAATFICNPTPGTCSFNGVTGGFSNVKRTAKQTATDKFHVTFPSAGTAILTFTTSKLTFGNVTFNGTTFHPIVGAEYFFDIAHAGSYDLFVTVSNLTKTVSSYSGTIDFAAVPEPASWAMMIGGFGLAGMAMRRRTQLRPAIA